MGMDQERIVLERFGAGYLQSGALLCVVSDEVIKTRQCHDLLDSSELSTFDSSLVFMRNLQLHLLQFPTEKVFSELKKLTLEWKRALYKNSATGILVLDQMNDADKSWGCQVLNSIRFLCDQVEII